MCWPRAIQSQFLLIPPGISVLSLSYRMKTRDSEPRPHRLSISALTQILCRSPTPSSAGQRGSCRRAGPLLRRGLRGLGSLLCMGSACSEPHSLPSLSLRPGSSWMSCSLLPKLAGSSRSRASRAYVPFPAVFFSYTWASGGLGLAGFSAFVSPSGGSEGTATQLCAARTSPVGQLSPAAQGTAQACPEVSLAPISRRFCGPPSSPFSCPHIFPHPHWSDW